MTYSDIDRVRLPVQWLRERRGFITGATGWIGSWVCQALDSIGARYLYLAHTTEESTENFRFPEFCDYIIHLAPGRVGRVIECAEKFDCPVLFTSSGAVYMQEPNEYAIAKQDNERAFLESVDVKIARCYTFAGAGIPIGRGYALGNFISAALCGQPMHVWSNGLAIRSYMYMSDLVTWLFAILIDGAAGKAYDVGSEDEISILELAHIIRVLFDRKPEIIVDAGSNKEPLPYYIPDTREAQALGCETTIDTEEAIIRTVRSMKEQYA